MRHFGSTALRAKCCVNRGEFSIEEEEEEGEERGIFCKGEGRERVEMEDRHRRHNRRDRVVQRLPVAP